MPRTLLAPLALALVLPTLAPAETRAPEAPAPDVTIPDSRSPDLPTVQERLDELIDRLMGRFDPSLDVLGEWLGDLSGYHPPEILPNGDILIRRRAQPPVEPVFPERVLPERPLPAPPSPGSPAPERAEPPITEPFEL